MSVRIGNYKLGKTLGKGSFGKVKLATHVKTGHRVAVKILNRQKLKNSRMDQKIRREIKILKLFRHPHIIRLYEVIETATDIFMVMEYVSGGELFDYIVQHGPLSEAEARRFFQQVISGVEYCHKYMVVHRDLKPENLLLDSEMNVKIADFGLSNIMKDGDFLRTSCGSPNYAAPEVISGKLYAGPEVDVWSCGVILYALLCGRLPFDEDTIPSLFKKIKEADFVMPKHLSKEVRELISAILVVDPMQRITIADIRQTAWFVKDLPDYLATPAGVIEKDNIHIDESVLKEVAHRFHMDYEMAKENIRRDEINDATLAYHLIFEEKMKTEQGPKAAVPSGSYDKSYSISPATPFSLDSGLGIVSPMNSPPTDFFSDAMSSRHRDPPSKDAASKASSSSFDPSTPERWHLGIHFNMGPQGVMQEVYRALKLNNFVWKTAAPFHLKAKAKSPAGQEIKISLHVFKVQETKGCLLDIKKLEGETFPFMDSCATLFQHFETDIL